MKDWCSVNVVQQDYAGLSFKNRAITWTHKLRISATKFVASVKPRQDETSQLQKSVLAFSFRLTVCPAAFRAAAASCRDLINGIVLCFLYLVTLHKKNTLAYFGQVSSSWITDMTWYDTCFDLMNLMIYLSCRHGCRHPKSCSRLSKLCEGHRPQTLRVQQHSAEQRVTRHGTSEHSTVQLARCNWEILIHCWYTWGILF